MQNKSRTIAGTSGTRDRHRADIVAGLRKAGWTLRALSRAHGKHPTALGQALARPIPAYERLIAEALGEPPESIWPTRYARRAARGGAGLSGRRPMRKSLVRSGERAKAEV